MRRCAAAVLAVLMIACTGSAPSPEADGDALSLPDRGDGQAKETKKDHRAANERSKDRFGDPDGGARPSKDERSGPSGGSRPSTTDTGEEPETGPLAIPDAGSYSYVQSGWEELCRGANCDRSDLPPSQTVKISFEEKSRWQAVFVSETQGSGSRTQALTYEVTADRAIIRRLESTFASGAFKFTASIVPDPPVTAAVFPLETGDRWSGRWKDRGGSVDGAYDVTVLGRDRMMIDGRAEEVVVMDTTMRLSGDYRGTNEMRLWVTPADFTIVASKGFTDIDSDYGTYRSRFATSYRSGPGK